MVYRGKPSAGCENCRKAKKKCTLEQPACTRCVKLNKQCSGYRDTTGLQIQDETLSVTRKAEKRKLQSSSSITPAPSQNRFQTATPGPDPGRMGEPSDSRNATASSQEQAPAGLTARSAPSLLSARSSTPLGIPTPQTINSESSSSSEGTLDMQTETDAFIATLNWDTAQEWTDEPEYAIERFSLPQSLSPKPDEVAVSYFLNSFTASGHWDYILRYAALPALDPCLTLAIKACGMAALENVAYIPRGREWSRNMYLNAIGLLNEALRDPKRSKSDESLIAVSMLSFFEVGITVILLLSKVR